MSPDSDQYRTKQYSEEEYIQEKLFYYQKQFELEHTFQKSLLNASLGALVLSVTLFQIFHQEKISNLYLLILSWLFLFAASFLSIKRFRDGKSEIKKCLDKLKQYYRDGHKQKFKDQADESLRNDLRNKHLKRIEDFANTVFDNSSNNWTMIFITLGILSLISFFLINI